MTAQQQTMPLLDVLQEWLGMDRDVTVGSLVVFLGVSQDPGIACHALGTKLGFSPSSVSRITSLLSKERKPGVPGLGLIELIENPENRRERLCYLSIKGQQLYSKMRALPNLPEVPKGKAR